MKYQFNNIATKYQNRLLTYLLLRKNPSGFTLIELMVVMIFISVLTLISLPNFTNQIGKSRELEAKHNLGAIARAQQAYHFEKQTFAPNISNLNLDFNFTSKYYNFPPSSLVNNTIVKHQAIANNPGVDQIKNYAIAVYYDEGNFEVSFCQARAIYQSVEAPDTPSGNCTNNGIKLQ
jgi:type IV pilus assembly protein PilA